MADEVQRTVIVREGKPESKITRYVVKPIKRLATWEVKDGKKDRVTA